jgi:hypothetical protein
MKTSFLTIAVALAGLFIAPPIATKHQATTIASNKRHHKKHSNKKTVASPADAVGPVLS